jgi:nitroimidazol reductase NimA-like FMN-containing flavoprotein (pyridoxamine 5'-phosphate oxidase superfamily)
MSDTRAAETRSPASTPAALALRDLTQAECEQLLSRNRVGRIAFTFRGKVDIEPIHYVFDDGALYVRTTHGTKLTVIAHHPWVAFEVDEARGPSEWESVVVKGTVYHVDKDSTPRSNEAYEHAKAVIRSAMPAAFTPDDPVPDRSILLRIHIHEMEGRASRIVARPVPSAAGT